MKNRRDKLAQCRHKRWVTGAGEEYQKLRRCADCGQLLSLGEADEPALDVAAGRLTAFHCGLADGEVVENLYLHDGGSLAITTGDQGDAWAWDVSRPIAEQAPQRSVKQLVVDVGNEIAERYGLPMLSLFEREVTATYAAQDAKEAALDARGYGRAGGTLDDIAITGLDVFIKESEPVSLADAALIATRAPVTFRSLGPVVKSMMADQIAATMANTGSGVGAAFGKPAWSPPVEAPLDLHLGSCDTLTDRAFPCNCTALREQHSQRVPATSENCKLLGAETCTHDHMTEAEPVAAFRVYCGRCGADPCACDDAVGLDTEDLPLTDGFHYFSDGYLTLGARAAIAIAPVVSAVLVQAPTPRTSLDAKTDEECDKFGEGLADPGDAPHRFVAGKFLRGERGGQWPEETCNVCGRDPRNSVHDQPVDPDNIVACSAPGCLATIDTLLLLEDTTWSIRGPSLFCPAHTVGAT